MRKFLLCSQITRGSVAFSAIALACFAQQVPPQQNPTSRTVAPATAASAPISPVVTTAAPEVLVDMVVRDKRGNFIRDLSPEEVVVTDSGTLVKILALRLVAGSSPQVTPTAGAIAPQATNGAAVPGSAPAPTAVRLVSLVFERYDVTSARLALETVEEMLKVDTQAKLFFAVMQVNHRLRLIQTYTSDRALVRRAAALATGGPRGHLDTDVYAIENQITGSGLDQTASVGQADIANVEMLSKAIIDSDQNSRDMQSRPALDSLRALAQSLGTQPGRKTIVYFSQGLPLTGAGKDGLNALINTCSRSNVGVYVADVTGLTMASRTQASNDMLAAAGNASAGNTQGVTVASSVPNGMPGGPQVGGPAGVSMETVKASDRLHDITSSDSQTSLMELAKRTGGFYIGDANDLRKPARRLIEEVATYYEAAFAPQNTKFDGSFHPLAVTVQRKGAIVQARSGYLALPPGTPPDVQPFEVGLLKSLSDAEPSKAIEFRAGLVRFGRDSHGADASAIVEIPLSQFEFHEDGTNKTFEVHPRILVLLKNDSGTVVKKFSQDLPYHGASQAMEQMKHGVYTFQRNFTGVPGSYRMEVAVEDVLTGTVGTRAELVKIEALANGAELSSVSLVQRFEALPEAATAEYFRYQNSRVVPSLSRTIFKEKAPSLSTFFVIYPDAKSAEKPKLEIEISLRGELLGRLPMELPATSAAGPIPYIASIPTASLRPGPYELTAIVTQGKEVAEQRTTFVIDGPEPERLMAKAAVASGGPGGTAGGETDAPVIDVPIQSALVITRVDNAIRPSDEDQTRMIAIARERSLDYQNTLPDFTCIQVTHRWIDPHGQSKWQAKDSVTELLRYVDKHEEHHVIEVGGVKQSITRAKLGGVFSSGEFGGLLKAVFDPDVKAVFTWKELATLGNQTCNVFSFHVERKNSKYSLAHGPNGQTEVIVGFHGLIYVDANSYSIRRVSIEAEDVPRDFLFQSSQISVDYDLVTVGDHEYMLPVAAQMLVRMGKRNLMRNDIKFSDHRRFGANSSIKFN